MARPSPADSPSPSKPYDMSFRPFPTNVPRTYATEKLGILTQRLNDPVIGPATKDFAVKVFPNVDAEVFHGFTSFTLSNDEDTFPKANSKFHEIGLYQTEAGTDPHRAPAEEHHLESNNWALLHRHEAVIELLGKPATMINGEWKTALKDQIAVGLVNLRFEHAKRLKSALGHDFSSDPSSHWFILCVFTAFSRGQGGAKKLIAPHWDTLKNLAENDRWPALRRLVAADIDQGLTGSTNAEVKTRPAYAIIRTEQKFEAGRLLAQSSRGNADWFVSGYSSSAQDQALEEKLSLNAGKQ